MSIFGAKNNDNLSQNDGDEDIKLDFEKVEGQPKSRKTALLVAVPLLVAVAAGGYFYLSMQEEAPVVARAPQKRPVMPAPPAVTPAAEPSDAALAQAMIDPTAPAEANKMSDIPAAAGAPAHPAATDEDPAAALAAAALASVDAESQKISPAIDAPDTIVPALPDAAHPATPIMPQSDMKAAEAAATPAVPVDAAAKPVAATEKTPDEKKLATVVAETAAGKRVAPPVETAPAAAAPAPTAPVAAITAPANEADLPLPPQEPTKTSTTPAIAAAVAPATTPAAAAIPGQPVSGVVTGVTAGEKVVAPATPSVNDLMAPRPAIVRVVPDQYLIVKKTHDANDIDSRLTSARQALASGDNQAAAQLFNDLSRAYPKDTRIMMGRAVALQRLGQNEQAIAGYEDVLNANPKNLEALTNMLGLIKLQNPGLAAEKLATLRETYPDNADITTQLALSYAGMGNYQDATRYLDIAEALSPGNPNIIYNKAVLYDKMGRSTEAGELYRQVLRMSSDDIEGGNFNTDAIKRRLNTLR